MTITTLRQDDQITFQLDGWLDTLSSPELGEESVSSQPSSWNVI